MWFTQIAQVKNPGQEEMHGFIQGVEQFLAFVLERKDDFGFLWADDPELHDLAWETFKMDVVDSVGTVHLAIDKGLSERQVRVHGLTGRAMRFKLRVVDALARRWEKFKGQLNMREWVKQMFEAIDAILDSLIEAAGGAGGLIKEFKDALCALATTA